MDTRIIKHGMAVLALMFLIGSSCSDNSGLKAQLAAAQQQAAMQAQYQAQVNQLQNQNSLMQQKNADFQKCLANGGNPTGCGSILN